MEKPLEHLIFSLKKAISFQFINYDSMDRRYWNPLHYLPILLLGITSFIGLVLCDKKSHKFNYLMNCLTNMCEGDKTILDVAIHADLPFRLHASQHV